MRSSKKVPQYFVNKMKKNGAAKKPCRLSSNAKNKTENDTLDFKNVQ